MRAKTSPRAILLLGLLAACGGGNSAPQIPSLIIGPNGGTITVTDGVLAGTSLTVLAGSLTAPVAITIVSSTPPFLRGFREIGPGTRFGPPNTSFDPAASATLIFDPAQLPPGTATGDLVVKRRNSQGRITDLIPQIINFDAGTVVVPVDEFSTYWVVASIDRFTLSEDYFPMLNGDTFVYDNGMVLTVSDSVSEPNLQNVFVTRLIFELGGRDLGLYVDRILGETVLFGEFSLSDDFQVIDNRVLPWLPANLVLGTTQTEFTDFLRFTPFGALLPSGVGVEDIVTTVVSQGSLPTPMGIFPDVYEVRMERTIQRGNSTVPNQITDTIWFARGVGPIRVDIGELGRGTITEGVVGGRVVLPPTR